MPSPGGGTSCQVLDVEARSRSRSPLVTADGAHSVTEASSTQHNVRDAEYKRSKQAAFLASRAAQPQNFTLRAILVGTAIGTIICLSNTYFGLQTGWISGMAMPSALLGFAWFRTFSRFLKLPFTPVENVLVQCVAGAVGTMPLGVGLVGVVPALEFLMKKEEGAPLTIPLGKLVIWSLGVCFFGVFVAVPLRREVLIREKLKFPSGTATGLMIGVLHNDDEALDQKKETDQENEHEATGAAWEGRAQVGEVAPAPDDEDGKDNRGDWRSKIRRLTVAFGASFGYTIVSYFIPQLRNIPILGPTLGYTWQWMLNPSPAYVGQGVIMGPATTIHMLLGAILGWGILSPIAKDNGWAPGAVDDWETGSKGWMLWVSLAIVLADSLINLAWLVLRPVIENGPAWYDSMRARYKAGQLKPSSLFKMDVRGTYQRLDLPSEESHSLSPRKRSKDTVDLPEADAPPEHLPGWKMTYGGLLAAVVICIGATHFAFPGLIPFGITILSVVFSLLVSIMGIRALGETDLNPVSGISKLTQLAFAAILPHTPAAIPANLLAGAITEAAALQAGDMMQDLKTGHILGASPKYQFYGQIIGSGIGAVVSACVYKLYTSVYTIPGGQFQIPTGYVWIFTARLVTGQGLPAKAGQAASIAGAVWSVLTILRIRGHGKWWQPYIPGGVAVAVGMYNTPNFTLARTVGGLLSWWWARRGGREEVLIVLASGLILGEGVGSIGNLLLASGKVPHL